uniref:Galectin n=1 Tax=Meloidogyne javanica TaxID=6303 RepID=A0A915MGG8_MELJA
MMKIKGTTARFFISDPRKPKEGEAIEEQIMLREEQAKFGDLVFIHGFEDTYHNLHFKVIGLDNFYP